MFLASCGLEHEDNEKDLETKFVEVSNIATLASISGISSLR